MPSKSSMPRLIPNRNVTALTHFARLDAARLLALGGIAFLVCGMLTGEIYAIYISHVANGIISQNWQGVISAVSNGDMEALTKHFSVIQDLAEKRGRTMNTHSHIGAYGLLALVLAHVQPYLTLSSPTRRVVANVYLIGAVLQFGAVYLSYYVGDWLFYLADLGALLVILACGRTLLALRSSGIDTTPLNEHLAEQLAPAASRYLVKSGLLLIVAGMSFGLYYAWVLVSHDEPAVYGAINDATALIVDEDIKGAQEQIMRFKRAQSKIAITAAAHSHAIEFGFLMLMLALVQRFVLLRDKWRLTWARVLSVGAYMLPVCVFLATKYGLRAAAFADISGALVLIALVAMAFGIVRYTGVTDHEAGQTSS